MQKKWPWWSMFIATAALFAGPAASAAGIGSPGSGATLGQPLDFSVQLRLEPGESLGQECVSAEVMLGDRRLAPAAVRTVLQASGGDTVRVRIITAVVVDEPVVSVQLNAGCGSRLSRRFVVLADPPVTTAPAAPPSADAAFAPSYAAAPPGVPLPVAAGAAPATPSLAQAGRPPGTRGAKRAERRALPAARPAVAQRTRKPPAAPVAAAQPRLKLDAAEPLVATEAQVVDQALEAVAQAASAARFAAAAASEAAARISTLEASVSGLRKEAKASQELAAELRERLVQAEGSGRWTWPLLALALFLAGLVAWLALRLKAAENRRQAGWQAMVAPAAEPAAAKVPTSPIPFVTSEIRLPQAPAAAPRIRVPAWPAPAVLPPPDTEPGPAPVSPDTVAVPAPVAADDTVHRTEVLAPRAAPAEAAPRDVSIDELIDLEQQAEFFVVLGQDDAAVDLLVDHLQQTGGGSPLPYLKLLEIYRRRGDLADYERLRTRFNHRFNAYAPDWDSDLQAGRTLETYAGVLPRLQHAWPRPLDAMVELEALLFRKSRGELFDLPAYREVLFLYALARDLLDREAADSGNVDVLLPLSGGGEFSSTAPAPFMGLEPGDQPARADLEARATAPLDFDLSVEADRPTSIFGSLDGATDPTRRR